MAQDLLETVPDAVLVEGSATTDMHRRPTVHRVAKPVLLTIATTLAVVGVASQRGSSSAASVGDVTSSAATETTAIAASTSPSSTTSVSQSSSAMCPSRPPVADDLDGDGCGDPIHVEDDRVVVVGERRFLAGDAGDRIAIGDWDCDGVANIAVLRPSSGSVFVFDRWATNVSDVSVPPITTVPGAVDLQTRDRGDGCTSLVAVRADGTIATVT
jgi:hypothetical protein